MRYLVEYANFCHIVPKVKICHLVIPEVTKPNFVKFIHNVAKSLSLNILNRNCDIPICFVMQACRMKVAVPILL